MVRVGLHEHFLYFPVLLKRMIMNLYSAFSILIYSNALYKQVIYGKGADHNTGNSVPYSFR